MLQQLLHSKDINTKQCVMALKIPYSTLSDLMNGTTSLSKTSGEILYKLAKFFPRFDGKPLGKRHIACFKNDGR